MKSTRYRFVEEHIKKHIQDLRLSPGQSLPSIRALSIQLNVAKNSVIRAYQELEAQGMVESVPRSGFVIANNLDLEAQKVPLAASPQVVNADSITKDILHHPTLNMPMAAGSAHPYVDTPEIRSLYAEIGRQSRLQANSPSHYQLPPGSKELRQQLSLIAKQRKVDIGADDIIVTMGAQPAITMALRAITSPGDIIAVESPCYFGVLLMAESLELKVVEIPSDPITGIQIELVRQALAKWDLKALIVTPNFNNPSGSQMPLSNRIQLLDTTQNLPIIEDDIFSELSYSTPLDSLKNLDTSDRVIYVSSLSKSLDSRLRIGWLAAGKIHSQIERQLLLENMGSPNLIQQSLIEFLKTGKYQLHMKKMRRRYSKNMQYFIQSLKTTLDANPTLAGKYQLFKPNGSFLCWLQINGEIDTYPIYKSALQNGISLLPGTLFGTRHQFKNCIRFNVALIEKETIWSEKIKLLVDIIEDQYRKQACLPA